MCINGWSLSISGGSLLGHNLGNLCINWWIIAGHFSCCSEIAGHGHSVSRTLKEKWIYVCLLWGMTWNSSWILAAIYQPDPQRTFPLLGSPVVAGTCWNSSITFLPEVGSFYRRKQIVQLASYRFFLSPPFVHVNLNLISIWRGVHMMIQSHKLIATKAIRLKTHNITTQLKLLSKNNETRTYLWAQ